MLEAILVGLLQAAAGPVQMPQEPEPPAAEAQSEQTEQTEQVVCRRARETGSRVRARWNCSSRELDRARHNQRRVLGDMVDRSAGQSTAADVPGGQ